MKNTTTAMMFVFAFLTLAASHVSAAVELRWGENVGIISATVTGTDDANGLTVRSKPSLEGKILGHLQPGTRVQGQDVFRDGWVNLNSPIQDGWVQLSYLTPKSFTADVTKSDQDAACLALRQGPGKAYGKTGCAQVGQSLQFTGVATSDHWLQLADRKGWVPASQLSIGTWALAAGTYQQLNPAEAHKTMDQRQTAVKEEIKPQAQQKLFKRAPDEEDEEADASEAVVCANEWCVDFAKDAITYQGKPESLVTCARDETCARILAEFWVALLEDDEHVDIPVSNTMEIRLARDGTIRNAASHGIIENCEGTSGPNVDCVVGFMLEISQPLLEGPDRVPAGSASAVSPGKE